MICDLSGSPSVIPHAPPRRLRGKISVGRKGFGPTYVAHIPPIVVWYSRDSLCYGVGACMAYITAKAKKKKALMR